MKSVKTTIQARLDKPSQRALARLVRQLGWSQSKAIREGLLVLAACHLGNGQRKIIGQGQFDSGLPDLGSNKKHMEGFGR